jgi:hypothetical protein
MQYQTKDPPCKPSSASLRAIKGVVRQELTVYNKQHPKKASIFWV